MQGGHPIGRARAALRALHRAQRSGDLESDLESNVAQSGNLEVLGYLTEAVLPTLTKLIETLTSA